MVDLLLVIAYLIAASRTKNAIAPALAFTFSGFIGAMGFASEVNHMCFLAIYLLIIPLSNIRIMWPMLLSAMVNLMATAYFLSPTYIEGFELYFAVLMTMVNLYILFTIFRGAQNGVSSGVDTMVIGRALDLCNIQTRTKTHAGR